MKLKEMVLEERNRGDCRTRIPLEPNGKIVLEKTRLIGELKVQIGVAGNKASFANCEIKTRSPLEADK